jgi:hypothetical protein
MSHIEEGVLAKQVMWRSFFAERGVRLHGDFDISTLAHMSEGFTPAAMKQARPHCVHPVAIYSGCISAHRWAFLGAQIVERGLAGSHGDPEGPEFALEVLGWLRQAQPSNAAEAAAEVWEWRMRTPAYKALMEGEGTAASAAKGNPQAQPKAAAGSTAKSKA